MEGEFAQPARILVVDDNAQNRALVEATLQDEGHIVRLASSGQEALALFEAELFDCVLLDVKMPGMDGLTLCRHLRAHARGAELPILFLTALRDVDTFDAALRAGGDDFLVKPVRPTELVVRVEGALKLRRLTAENREFYAIARDQRDALMRLQLLKEQLTAFLVHDLKNPVNALDLHAQLLLRDSSLSERARESATAIRQEAKQLLRLITNMLEISKSDEDGLSARLTTVKLVELLEPIQTEFLPRAEAKGVELALDVQVDTLEADPDILRRLFENLLDNALRYAPEKSRVTVSALRRDGHVELRVSDQGPGVPEAMREAVFERFQQLGKGRSAQGGYGLGLAFCKLAAELHGGRIWVEDAAPGAVFCVSLRQ